jgi:hypothetical protein
MNSEELVKHNISVYEMRLATGTYCECEKQPMLDRLAELKAELRMKQCSKCGITSKNVIRYPTHKMDTTVNFCDSCAEEVGYTFQ